MMELHILNGPHRGESFFLENAVTILGRSRESQIHIQDKSVSRKHLKICRKGKDYFIEDLETSSGTLLNGVQIDPSREYRVHAGHRITVGKTLVVLGNGSLEEEWGGVGYDDTTTELNAEDLALFDQDRPLSHFKNMELLYKISMILMGSLNISEIFQNIIDYVFGLLKRIDRAAVLLIDEKTGELKQITAKSKYGRDEKTIYGYSRSIVNRTIEKGQSIVVQDTGQKGETHLSDSMECIRSVLCVPLISKSQVRGVIYVDSLNRPNGFRKEDLYLLTAISSSAAVALENAGLYSNLEQMVEERTKKLKKTQERLRESEARFKAIFNNMSSGVVVYKAIDNGENFIVLDVNTADAKAGEFKKGDKLGKSVLQSAPPELNDLYLSLLELLRRVWETEKPERQTITVLDGEKIRASREYSVYLLPTGEIVAIYDDVTDKFKAEAEQKALQEQLFRSQKMESIGAFAGGTAHNFRNILQAISGNIEYLEMLYAEMPEVKELAGNVYDSVGKGVDLINNLLHFSQREENCEFADTDLARVITEAYNIISRVFDKSIQIELDLKEDLFVRGNHALLSQIFMNLFTNARDAMPEGGKLRVEAARQGDKVIAHVSDMGCGMDKETLERIFDPFFTLKEVGKGTGLGLSTTLGIVEQHNGTISVRSELGKGTTFTVCFPLSEGKDLPKSSPQKELIRGKNGQRVLIVDDEKPALDALTHLSRSLGYEAIPFDHPAEALKNYGKWAPDVVLMDRNMPEMNGSKCVKELIKMDPNARIIMVSGYDGSGPDGIDEDVRRLTKGYLTKPFKLEALSAAINDALK
ncbi:MAG: response regulator [Deltaproteobacteria bacterium]|nr:response regulator [Deltaproteobacteria bacterium]